MKLTPLIFLLIMSLLSIEVSFGQAQPFTKNKASGADKRGGYIRVLDQESAVCDEIETRLRKYNGANARIMDHAFKWIAAKPDSNISERGIKQKNSLIDINNDGVLERVSRFGDWEGYVSDKPPVKDSRASLEFIVDRRNRQQPNTATFVMEPGEYSLKHVPKTKYPSGTFGDSKIDLRQDEGLYYLFSRGLPHEATLVTGFYPVLIKGQVYLVFKSSDDTNEPDAGEYPFRRWIVVAKVRVGFVQPSLYEELRGHLDDICYFIEADSATKGGRFN